MSEQEIVTEGVGQEVHGLVLAGHEGPPGRPQQQLRLQPACAPSCAAAELVDCLDTCWSEEAVERVRGALAHPEEPDCPGGSRQCPCPGESPGVLVPRGRG